MRRIKRTPEKYELVRIGDSFARSLGLDLRDSAWHRSFLTDMAARLDDLRQNAALIHGQRVENMFAYVAGALRGCRLVKQEDAGAVYVETTMRPPDFPLVMTTGEQLLIEAPCVGRERPSRVRTLVRLPTLFCSLLVAGQEVDAALSRRLLLRRKQIHHHDA